MCFNTLSSRNKAILSCLSDRPRPAWRSCEAPRLESFSKGKSPCLENWEALALFVRRRTKSLISLIMLKSTTWRLTWRSVLQTFLTSWCVMISSCFNTWSSRNKWQCLIILLSRRTPAAWKISVKRFLMVPDLKHCPSSLTNDWASSSWVKKRPDVTGVNWHPPVQRLICRTLVARCPGWQTTSTSLWPYSKLPGRNAAQVRSPVAQVEMQMSFLQIVSMSTAWTN